MHTYISDLTVGTELTGDYYVEDASIKKTKAGKDYLNLNLADKSGTVGAKMWDGFSSGVLKGVFVKIVAKVDEFNSRKQLIISTLSPLNLEEVDTAIYLKKSVRSLDEMYEFLLEVIKGIQDIDIKRLLESFFINDEKIASAFKQAPAAKSMHNAFIGGLLEHVTELLKTALFICDQYPSINRDLLLAGIILHDIGKIEELQSGFSISYSDVGKLVGHHTIGILLLNDKIRELEEFPANYKLQLEHMIISHHGQPEWGSVKRPATLEAVVLHHLDNIDSKITGFEQFLAENPPEDGWTKRAYMFDSELYVGSVDDDK